MGKDLSSLYESFKDFLNEAPQSLGRDLAKSTMAWAGIDLGGVREMCVAMIQEVREGKWQRTPMGYDIPSIRGGVYPQDTSESVDAFGSPSENQKEKKLKHFVEYKIR